jgi:hypothetical protein
MQIEKPQHGYTILKQEPTPAAPATRAGRIVLVEKPDANYHPYVTAWLGEGDTQWCGANYFSTLDNATIDYYERCLRDARLACNRRGQGS